jgi:AraC-like DNA-binding protein/PAS domain-containing protein
MHSDSRRGRAGGEIVKPRALPESRRRIIGHLEHVHTVANGGGPHSGIEEVSTSWERSARKHGVDPADARAPNVLTHGELRGLREPLGELIRNGRDGIDKLYNIVRRAGYVVLLCNTEGIAVDHRAENIQADEFRYWGTWLGGVWSEEIEGTNGIGTCIAEERPITVHRNQHFRSRHIDLSCSGAPIFGIDGKLLAVLDVSAVNPGLSDHAHALAGGVTTMFASVIEERLFRESFRHDWIIAIPRFGGETTDALIAVDSDQRIVGANRAARTMLSLDDSKLHLGISLWTIFAPSPDVLRSIDGAGFPIQLMMADSNEVVSAVVAPPGSPPAPLGNLTNVAPAVRARPALVAVESAPPVSLASGGLPPGALRRVREYIDVHLGEHTQLVELATVAGVSVHHFAREFKRSTGLTPHGYLIQKRVERSRDMLAQTAWSLSEIAFAAGFSDQSHMARHFRRLIGVTPGEFRWSLR